MSAEHTPQSGQDYVDFITGKRLGPDPVVDSPHSVPEVLPEEIARAAEAVRAIVQGEMDELMAENRRLEEQFEIRDTAIRAAIEMGLDHPDALETLHAALRGSNPASRQDSA